MHPIQKLCTPRSTVIGDSFKDYALNLSDLQSNAIEPGEFFAENYTTEGMNVLLQTAFERFEGKSHVSVIKLTQAMGGGKTHNMIALALLARHPELRKQFLSGTFKSNFSGPVRVAAFSGRQIDYPYGVWGSIAEQLGKLDAFADYYQPLQAPGETAWINLLKGEPLLILLDELPPYFEGATAKQIGNSDLARVTTTGLSNLIVAASKQELANVLIVVSDLKATYESGSAQLSEALRNLDNEVGRTAIDLQPVRLNSDEIYHILRKKLFEQLPSNPEIKAVASAYADEMRKAKQMDLTAESPEEFGARIQSSYPFHPAVKDLYARFRENPGFQQTRGLIRLLRALIRSLYLQRHDEKVYLLSPAHFDLDHSETVALVSQINPALTNAISHDIASAGAAEAQRLDQGLPDPLHAHAAKVIYFSSLSAVQNAVKGLPEREIVAYLVEPGRDISQIRRRFLSALQTTCWYLHIDREGKYVFKDVQNVVAKVNSLVSQYDVNQARKTLQELLRKIFEPAAKDVYQKTQVLEPIDTISLSEDQVSLIVCSPAPGLTHPDIQAFYESQDFKNRAIYLTGEKQGMDSLLAAARSLKAIESIIGDLESEKVQPREQQYVEATNLKEQYLHHLHSATRETFTRVFYPSADKLMPADFSMNFNENKYDGEKQIRETLEKKQKFTGDIDSDTFRQKCELRLFGGAEMEWSELKKRAARSPVWQLHPPGALDRLKEKMLRTDQWRQNGKFIQKGPFPPPVTSIRLHAVNRDVDTGETILKVEPINGDTVYYDFSADPTEASMQVKDFAQFRTSEMRVRFLCLDSTGKHPRGTVVEWKNSIQLKYEVVPQGNNLQVKLQAIPAAPVKYTTDGSHPRELGGKYEGPFSISKSCVLMAIAEKDGIESETLQVTLDPKTVKEKRIDPGKALSLRKQISLSSTKETYDFLDALGNFGGEAADIRCFVSAADNEGAWAEFLFGEKMAFSAEGLEESINHFRKYFGNPPLDHQVRLTVRSLSFKSGADFDRFKDAYSIQYNFEDLQQ
jgi:hypothetical protein